MPSLKSTLLAAALLAITQADYIIDPETVSKGMRGMFHLKREMRTSRRPRAGPY